jgi:hypothetical protein
MMSEMVLPPEFSPESNNIVSVIKKKGRRKKVVNDQVPEEIKTKKTEKPVNKPSSKKSKITKIITSMNKIESTQPIKSSNVIIQLSCSLREIEEYSVNHVWKSNCFSYNPSVPNEIQAYDVFRSSSSCFGEYHPPELTIPSIVPELSEPDQVTMDDYSMNPIKYAYSNICSKCNDKIDYSIQNKMNNEETDANATANTILKLKQLKIQLHNNMIPDKNADCFWCTCPYDNAPCFVLQHGSKNEILGHGSFCSPECAVAHLFNNMKWDDSTKTESYQLMNEYYGKPTNCHYSIKPACSPYYLLEKFYGNMTIQEFRKMAKSKHMLLVVEKPVTRVLPEIHEDTDHFLSNGSSVNYRGNYKVKKQSEKQSAGPSRTSILRDNFGLAQ